MQNHFAACKEIQQSLGLWISSCGFRIQGTGSLVSTGFQSLAVFYIPRVEFRIPNRRIPDSTGKNFPVVIGETYNVQHCRHIFNVVEILGGYENAVISYVFTAHPC